MTKQVLADGDNGVLEPIADDNVLDRVYEQISAGRVEEGMSHLMPALQARRLQANDGEWAQFVQQCLNHPLRELVHEDPFTFRAFTKPRGYAGDAELMDFIYGLEEAWPAPPQTSPRGRQIFEFLTRSAACEGVRARRGFVAELVDRLVDEIDRPHILSIAAGHLREVLLSAAVKRRKVGRYVALDSDRESLEQISRCYSPYGVEVVRASIRQLLARKVQLERFHLVYSTGLFDYLSQPVAQRLTWAMFQMLLSRGRLLVANFLPGIRDVGYMESYMDWKLIYRTRQEMLELSMDIPQAEIRDITIFAEENQNIIFLQITKR